MGKLLEVLGATETNNKELLQAEELILGLQEIYQNSPESNKKNKLANAIAEAIRLLLKQIREEPLPTLKEDGTTNTPDNLYVGDIFFSGSDEPTTTFKIKNFTYRAGKNIAELLVYRQDGETLDPPQEIELDQEDLQDEVKKGLYKRVNQFTVGDKVTFNNDKNKGELTIKSILTTPYTYYFTTEENNVIIHFPSELVGYKPVVEVGKKYTMQQPESAGDHDLITNIYNDGNYLVVVFDRYIRGLPIKDMQMAVDNLDYALQTGAIKLYEEGGEEGGDNEDIKSLANWFIGKTLKSRNSETVEFVAVKSFYGGDGVIFDTLTQGTGNYKFDMWTLNVLKKLKNGETVNGWVLEKKEDNKSLPNFEEGEWYIAYDLYGDGDAYLFRFKGVENYHGVIKVHYYESFYTKNNEYERDGFFANSSWWSKFKKATKSEIEGIIIYFLEGLGLNEVGAIIDSTVIGKEEKNYQVETGVVEFGFYSKRKRFLAYLDEGNVTVYDSFYGFAKLVDIGTTKSKSKGARQSPSESANSVKAGTRKLGNDGNMWEAKKTSAGYNQWKKV